VRHDDRVEPICDVSVTAADAGWLAEWVRGLVEDRLVACGNIELGTVRSIYRWEGAVEDEAEVRVTLHTRQALVPRIMERADADHPYDTPQVLAVPIVAAHPGYHRWVLDSTTPP
jgi:periplasmic divalent cation tolerance protein